MKRLIYKKLSVFIILINVGLVYGQPNQSLVANNGTYSSTNKTVTFNITDNYLNNGFRLENLRYRFQLSPDFSSERSLFKITTSNLILANEDLIEVLTQNGQLKVRRPVRYQNGIPKYFSSNTWNESLVSTTWFDLSKNIYFEIAFTRMSIKMFVYGDDGIVNGSCELMFWGLGSDDFNGLDYEVDTGREGMFKIIFYQDRATTPEKGFISGTFNPSHSVNYKSCYSINTLYGQGNTADPVSGVTSTEKKNCSGSDGGQARVASSEDMENIENKISKEIVLLDSIDNVIVYPIPAQDKLTMDFPDMWWDTDVELSLVNLEGKYVFRGYRFSPSGREEVDISTIDPGIYWLITENNERRDVKRVIIE